MRFLNGFVLIGLVLLLISVAGAASGNRLLTEPGQQPNPYAWLEYLGAAALMLVNGAISISLANKNRAAEAKDSKDAKESKDKPKDQPGGEQEIIAEESAP